MMAIIPKDKMPVADIKICKLPYQPHPFVHGVRGGRDVWLRNDGAWTEEDGDPDCMIPFHDYTERK